MKIRWTKLICGLLFGLCLIAVCILAGRNQYRSFREIHCVSAAFDREGAYKLTAELAENYPYRVFGTEESRKAGKMIEDRLREYGLDVLHQVFEAERMDSNKFYLKFDVLDNDVDLMRDSLKDLTERVAGDNIIGMSQGKTDEMILLGAHRDIGFGIQGAEDNASGMGVLLQLAKELSATEHYYTYVFVAFDGEEAQEKGSRFFVDHFENLEKIRVAVILDEVGYINSDSLTLYARYGAFGQIPLPLQEVLYSGMTETSELTPECYEKRADESALVNFFSYLFKISFVSANTDCTPFYLKRIPAFGLRAWDKTGGTEAPIHCDADSMENVSAEALGRSGIFVKTLVQTLDAQPQLTDSLGKQGKYIIFGSGYLPSINVIACELLLILAMFFLSCFTGELLNVRYRLKEVFVFAVHYILLLSASGVIIVLWTHGLKSYLSGIPLLWLAMILTALFIVAFLIFRRFDIRKHCMRYSGQAQLCILFCCIPFLMNASTLEYAILVIGNAVIFNLASLKSCNRVWNAVLRVVFVILHIALWLATLNVFARGVNIRKYEILNIINTFIFLGMLLNAFRPERKEKGGQECE